ncbi:MAG: transposase, partial [Saprospiraceae bacterium]
LRSDGFQTHRSTRGFGLSIFYLPPYRPRLNIAERLWLELRARWLKPEAYISSRALFLEPAPGWRSKLERLAPLLTPIFFSENKRACRAWLRA